MMGTPGSMIGIGTIAVMLIFLMIFIFLVILLVRFLKKKK